MNAKLTKNVKFLLSKSIFDFKINGILKENHWRKHIMAIEDEFGFEVNYNSIFNF